MITVSFFTGKILITNTTFCRLVTFIRYRTTEEDAMNGQNLSEKERREWEEILLEEMDRQQWDQVTFSVILGEEIILTLQ